MEFTTFRSLVLKQVHKTYPTNSYARKYAPKLISTIDNIAAKEWYRAKANLNLCAGYYVGVEFAKIKVIDYIKTLL